MSYRQLEIAWKTTIFGVFLLYKQTRRFIALKRPEKYFPLDNGHFDNQRFSLGPNKMIRSWTVIQFCVVFKPYAFFRSDIFHNFVIMQFLFEKFVISLYQTSQHIVESGVKVKWRTNVVRKEDSNYKCLECGANEINDKWPSSKREIPDKLTVKTNEKKNKNKNKRKIYF